MLEEIPMNYLVISNKNVRKTINNDKEETNIETLANDIKINGLINPLSVRKCANQKYEVIAGQRRYLALSLLNVKKALCNIIEVDDEKAELISLSENLQRNKMSQNDKCEIFYKLYLLHQQNVNEVAKKINYSNYTVKDYVVVKENLAENLFKNLDEKGDNKLSMEIAVYLCKHISKESQEEVFNSIKSLGTTILKKQAIQELSNVEQKEEEQEDTGDKEVEDEKVQNQEEEEAEKKPKKKIPNEPWTYDDNNEPVLIPKDLQYHVFQMIKNA